MDIILWIWNHHYSVSLCCLLLLHTHNIKSADLIKFDVEGAEETFFLVNDPEEFATAYIGEVHGDLIMQDPDTWVSNFSTYDVEKQHIQPANRFILRAKRQRSES